VRTRVPITADPELRPAQAGTPTPDPDGVGWSSGFSRFGVSREAHAVPTTNDQRVHSTTSRVNAAQASFPARIQVANVPAECRRPPVRDLWRRETCGRPVGGVRDPRPTTGRGQRPAPNNR